MSVLEEKQALATTLRARIKEETDLTEKKRLTGILKEFVKGTGFFACKGDPRPMPRGRIGWGASIHRKVI